MRYIIELLLLKFNSTQKKKILISAPLHISDIIIYYCSCNVYKTYNYYLFHDHHVDTKVLTR